MKSTTYRNALICILLAISRITPVHAEDDDRLTRFKAVFVYNFLDYVKWPEEEGPVVFKIGILGDSSLEKPLRKIAEKKSTRKKKIQVDVEKHTEDLIHCHVLFIPSKQVTKLKEIMERLGERHVLTVTDTPGLADRGVAINFVLVKGNLRFEINQSALERAGLRASSQLLKLAILVEEKGEG